MIVTDDSIKLKFYSYEDAAKFFGCSRWKARYNKELKNKFYLDKTLKQHHSIKLINCTLCDLKVPAATCRLGYCKICSEKGLGRKEGRKKAVTKTIKWKTCIGCFNQVKTSKCRKDFCKQCSSKGLGIKHGAIKNSKRQLGKNNSNYVNGQSKVRFRQQALYRHWRKQVLKECSNCMVCGRTINRHTHHIIPCALFPQYKYEPWNGITLCGLHHKELHRQQLDLLLLPILYESLSDVLQLRKALLNQPQFQKLHRHDGGSCSGLELVRVVPKNYHKQILHLHPEFAQLVLGLSA